MDKKEKAALGKKFFDVITTSKGRSKADRKARRLAAEEYKKAIAGKSDKGRKVVSK